MIVFLIQIGYLFLGGTLVFLWFTLRELRKIKKKHIVDPEMYQVMVDNNTELSEEIDNQKEKYNKIKKYLGLVDEHKYGSYIADLTKSDKDYPVVCDFIVTQRGKDKVKIKVIDITTNDGSSGEKMLEKVQSLIPNWVDINDDKITWIEPNESLKREINIDSILQ